MKLKASHERHCSLAKLCFPIVIVTLNQMSCGAFLQRYPSNAGNRHVKASFGTPPPFPHMHHGLSVDHANLVTLIYLLNAPVAQLERAMDF